MRKERASVCGGMKGGETRRWKRSVVHVFVHRSEQLRVLTVHCKVDAQV